MDPKDYVCMDCGLVGAQSTCPGCLRELIEVKKPDEPDELADRLMAFVMATDPGNL